MAIVIEEELLAPPGFRFTASDDDTYDGAPDGKNQIGIGDTAEEAVRELLGKFSDEELEEARWSAQTWGESKQWQPLMEAEQADRRER